MTDGNAGSGRVITLLTDFGLRDSFVGTMKGVLLGIAPHATLVDIGHDLPPHDIRAGAFSLASAWRYFPTGTIHLAVVDPEVGSSRRAIAFEWQGHWFVGPENGLFGSVFGEVEERPARWSGVELPSHSRSWDSRISTTFHGRDVFAPGAAFLARGDRLESLGRAIGFDVVPSWPDPVLGREWDRGEIIAIDRFGNAITNIRPRGSGRFETESELVFTLRDHYAEVRRSDPLAVVGSASYGELSIREGDAAGRFRLKVGQPIWWYPVDPA